MTRPARKLPFRFAGPALCIVLMASCSSGQRISKVNDELRAANHDLGQEVLALKRRNNELEIELKRLAQQPPQTMPQEIVAHVPRIVEVNIGKLSHVRDEDGDGLPETLLLYVEPLDGRGRFTQMVGTLEINAAFIPSHGDPLSAGQATFAPDQVRDAYRSTLTGVHYTFSIPVQITSELNDGDASTLAVRATFNDGLTGQAITAERSISLK
jgi:hypothetical protein